MRDVFYTILVAWIVWRVINAIGVYQKRNENQSDNSFKNNRPKEGKTNIDYVPPLNQKISDEEGEYIDYEEVK